MVSYRVAMPADVKRWSIHSSDWSNCGLPASRHSGAMRETTSMAPSVSTRGATAR